MRTHRKPDLLFLLAVFVGIGVAISSLIQYIYTSPAVDESSYSSAAEGSFLTAEGSYLPANGSYRNVDDAASPGPIGQHTQQLLQENQLIQVSSEVQTVTIELNKGLVNNSPPQP